MINISELINDPDFCQPNGISVTRTTTSIVNHRVSEETTDIKLTGIITIADENEDSMLSEADLNSERIHIFTYNRLKTVGIDKLDGKEYGADIVHFNGNDYIVSLDDFDNLFADFIQNQLDLEDNQVRISYAQRGQKFPQIDKDTVFVKVFQEQDERYVYKQRKRAYDNETKRVISSQTAMRTLLLQVVFYGYNSDTLATTLNERFYFDSTKQFLYKNNLALVPDLTDFQDKTYEKINGQWWERSDLKLRFYNSVTVDEHIDTIDSTDIKYNFDGIKIIHDMEGN